MSSVYDELHDKGFELIDIPCNQFGNQTPESDAEVQHICTSTFGTKFPRMKKSNVNGENELPLYTYLKSEKGFKGFGESEMGKKMAAMFAKQNPDWDKGNDIKWNFTKFVIDRDGNVVARLEPPSDVAEVKACVESLL